MVRCESFGGETMSYNFNDIMEFKEFVSDSFKRGDYAQEIGNFNKGINTISNDKQRWDWVEGEKLYLAKSPHNDTFLIIYQDPDEEGGAHQYLWYYTPHNDGYRAFNTADYPHLRVIEYMVLDSPSLTFMNWINENPLEVKQ